MMNLKSNILQTTCLLALLIVAGNNVLAAESQLKRLTAQAGKA